MTFGIIGSMPEWMSHIHETMHVWEVPIISASGIVLAMSWALHMISKSIDCHDTGCHHGSCGPRKDKNAFILKIATTMFLVNITIYTFFHVLYHPAHAGHDPITGVVTEAHEHYLWFEHDHEHLRIYDEQDPERVHDYIYGPVNYYHDHDHEITATTTN